MLRVNDRLLELLGVSADPDDLIGADCEALALDLADRFADPERFVDRVDHVVDAREPVWNEGLVLDSGNAFERSYRPIEPPDGPGHLRVYYDVSDRRRREGRLEALNETARELMTAETREAVVETGVAAADSVLGLEANTIHPFEPGPVDLDSFVRTCWDDVDLGTARLDVRTARTIRADESRLERLSEHLLRNAVEHSAPETRTRSGDTVGREPTAGRTPTDDAGARKLTDERPDAAGGDGLTVTIGELEGGEGFSVEDDGPGIPPADRESVFAYGSSTAAGGTGLGLAVVERCAEVHGWAVSATERTDGGARFEITGVDFVADA
jgi:signal transduction histidine kinase